MALRVVGYISNEDTSEVVGLTGGVSVTATGKHEDGRRIDVGTSETTLTFDTNVGNAGYLVLINRDATNYVQIGFATTVYVMRLKAGEVAVLRIEPTVAAIYLKANTATCQVQFKLYED